MGVNAVKRVEGGAASRVAGEIRSDILSGRLPIGARIAGEHELMAKFCASRQTVREALRELAAEGLVQSRRGPTGGAFVAAPELAKIAGLMQSAGTMMGAFKIFPEPDILTAIFWMEAACCRLAAERRDPAGIAAMQQAIETTAKAPAELPAFFEVNTGFNRALWGAANNGPLQFLLHAFLGSLRGKISRSSSVPRIEMMRAFLLANHQAILDAIKAGDGEAAVRGMEENLAFWISLQREDADAA